MGQHVLDRHRHAAALQSSHQPDIVQSERANHRQILHAFGGVGKWFALI